MRDAFAKAMVELANGDSRLVLLSGDIGNRMFDPFKERFPERFFNCGVAEANMVGMAAGMAAEGLRPFVYTITPFLIYRAYEQIRVDVCYHNVPVVLVGVGGGLSYASLGATHQSLEDIAVLRVLPNMRVVCPCDPMEVSLATEALMTDPGPAFLRLGKKGEPAIHKSPIGFKLGKANVVREGKDICMLAAGPIIAEAIIAAASLESAGISAEVASFHSIKPFDHEYLQYCYANFKLMVTVEEHSVSGGLGGLLAEWAAAQDNRGLARLLTLGTGDTFLSGGGSQSHARSVSSLNAESISRRILDKLQSRELSPK